MAHRPFIPGERHHWWPKSLSQFWIDNNGLVSRIDHLGKVCCSSPTKTARISDAHNLRFGPSLDSTFEQQFDRPDGAFPRVVKLLECLIAAHRSASNPLDHFQAHTCADSDLKILAECLVSLVVRSPHFRQNIAALVDCIRSNVRKKEYKPLIAANIYQTYSTISKNIRKDGKFLILYSDDKEFIYGDGTYNNIAISSSDPSCISMLLPLTPSITVLYALPMEYMVEPRIVTLKANGNIVNLINQTTQIYSKEYLFFRFEQPTVSEYFLRREHLQYTNDDPILALIRQIPGV
ncbi:hypothetical protein HW44_01505 [Nitrosococcus oceani]|nr:hypothetical protein HW44_01505 [Nitrosococcus oceani]